MLLEYLSNNCTRFLFIALLFRIFYSDWSLRLAWIFFNKLFSSFSSIFEKKDFFEQYKNTNDVPPKLIAFYSFSCVLVLVNQLLYSQNNCSQPVLPGLLFIFPRQFFIPLKVFILLTPYYTYREIIYSLTTVLYTSTSAVYTSTTIGYSSTPIFFVFSSFFILPH